MSVQPASTAPDNEPGLKQNAIGFVDALVIGLASTAPAYSLAAVIGIVVVIAGVQASAVLLASFVPMFFIAAAFYYMNRADQDCGTTFSWVTRALGPWPGWLGGWAICTTGILVVGALAALWYAVVNSLSENFLFDTLSALLLMIAFYYALSGIACVVSYRRELLRSVRNFVFIGMAPLAGAIILGYLLVRSVSDLSDPEASYTGSSVLGVGVPLFIGAAFVVLGAILMVAWRVAGPRGYFERRGFEALPRGFIPGAAAPELAETPAGRT